MTLYIFPLEVFFTNTWLASFYFIRWQRVLTMQRRFRKSKCTVLFEWIFRCARRSACSTIVCPCCTSWQDRANIPGGTPIWCFRLPLKKHFLFRSGVLINQLRICSLSLCLQLSLSLSLPRNPSPLLRNPPYTKYGKQALPLLLTQTTFLRSLVKPRCRPPTKHSPTCNLSTKSFLFVCFDVLCHRLCFSFLIFLLVL